MNRKIIIAGNWKMHKTASEAADFANSIHVKETDGCEVLICAAYPLIPVLVSASCAISVGAQNVSEYDQGAYTGEVSADMLRESGVRYVICGHSERRSIFGETDETIRQKIAAVLSRGMTPIICIGESGSQRTAGLTFQLIAFQVKSALSGLTPEEVQHCVIAYEPVWAIGTGVTASAKEAADAAGYIRALLTDWYGSSIAQSVRILYGGSMNVKNAEDLLSEQEIDGGLIGGASLNSKDFAEIIDVAYKLAERRHAL